jgi:MraZ protein
MTHFMGTHRNRLDAKMRVSVPASFRSALRDEGGGLVLRASHLHPAIECWPVAVFESFARPLQSFDLFSTPYDDLAASLYADACTVEPDKEGRVVLPESLVRHAGLSEAVVFVGMGRGFHIWEPESGQRFVAAARERARQTALTLPASAA